jgi:hypothetical protein
MNRNVLVGAIVLGIVGSASLILLLENDDQFPENVQTKLQLEKALARISLLEKRVSAIETRKTPIKVEPSKRELETRILGLETKLKKRAEEAKLLANQSLAAAGTTNDPVLNSPKAVNEQLLAAVKEQVEAEVAKKAAETKKKNALWRNKEPTLAKVAEVLKLDANQQAVIEREVRQTQKKIREILDTPMEDGTVPVDLLVNAMALGKMKRREAGMEFFKFMGLMKNEVPGTEQSYSDIIDVAKGSLNQVFKKELSDEQFGQFKEWRFEPDRMKGIEDSPWGDLEERVEKRVLEMGDKQN